MEPQELACHPMWSINVGSEKEPNCEAHAISFATLVDNYKIVLKSHHKNTFL